MAEIEHPKLAVMFTDIKGYSRLMSEDEVGALNMLKEHNQIMESVIEAHGGRIVKKLGDSYMVIFDDGDSAVKCALHALNKIAVRNRQHNKPFEIRVGINEGPMVERDGDFFGETVNIAARLEQLASPMSAAVTERIVQDIATRIKTEARFVGAQLLKNIRYPVSIYALSPADSWKLFLGTDAAISDAEYADVLGNVASADDAWQRVEQLSYNGNLHGATRLAEAALSQFGGTYAHYAHLAALYLIARMDLEAESTLKMGEMLGQKSPDDEQYDWLLALIHSSEENLKRSPNDLQELLMQADAYLKKHPNELSMQMLVESVKARLTGNLAGLTRLAQQKQNSALILRGYAEALRDQNRNSDAYNMLEQTISVAPDVVDHQLRRLQWMVEGDDLESVLAESDQLAKQFPNDPRVYEWTGKTRLLHLDPFGAQWLFEQERETGTKNAESIGWLICSLMQQGRFQKATELARKEMRSAIRQNRQRLAQIYYKLAITGIYLQHWEGALEIVEEYKRYDANWIVPQAITAVAKHTRKLIPWNVAIAQLNELTLKSLLAEYPHPSALTALSLMPAAKDPQQWEELHKLVFFQAHRDWIIDTRHLEAAALEARGALQFKTVETWHIQLVPILTRLKSRLDHRLPSFLALAGLIETRLNNFTGGKSYLEQAVKLWRHADWPVWEIQEAESTLATALSTSSGTTS